MQIARECFDFYLKGKMQRGKSKGIETLFLTLIGFVSHTVSFIVSIKTNLIGFKHSIEIGIELALASLRIYRLIFKCITIVYS